MATLWGRTYTRQELMTRVGDISQLAGVCAYRIDGGSGDGLPVVDVTTGGGLRFTVVPGRALDISGAWYNGVPLAFRSATGETQGARYEPVGRGWERTAVVGLLATCGLDNIGAPCVDDGIAYGLHGRLSNLAASNVQADGEWQGDEYELWVTGRVRQAVMFGEKLELKRRISTSLGSVAIRIHDEITNLGFVPEPMMVLYHLNPGYPIVDAGARFHVRSRAQRPVNPQSAAAIDAWSTYGPPTAGWKEHVYVHEVEPAADGAVHAAVVNRAFGGGLGLGISYSKRQLPFLNQWKHTALGEYATGIEPANGTVFGRAQNRAEGTLQTLQPGETAVFDLTLTVLDGHAAIQRFLTQIDR